MVEFISIGDVLALIAEKIKLEPDFIGRTEFKDPAFSEAFKGVLERHSAQLEQKRKLSFAAQFLNEAIHNGNIGAITHWMGFNEAMQLHINNTDNKSKIIELLTLLTHVGRNYSTLLSDTVRNATIGYQSDVINDLNVKCDIHYETIRNEAQLGFDRKQIFQFFRDNEIEYAVEINIQLKTSWGGVFQYSTSFEDLPNSSNPNDNYKKTIYPALIIKTIKELGHDPLNLFVSDDGKTKGTKGLVWDKVEKDFKKENKDYSSFVFY